ncbi:MAG: hypothetical protein WCD86_25650 [Ktedonobacteraceae bacterium]
MNNCLRNAFVGEDPPPDPPTPWPDTGPDGDDGPNKAIQDDAAATLEPPLPPAL